MKYIVRAIKYFFYFSFICAAMVGILVAIGAADGNINTLFKDGYNSIVQIALFFVAVAAIYPKLGFIRRKLYINIPLAQARDQVIEYMTDKRYVLETESPKLITFRVRGFAAKVIKMYEDRITLSEHDGQWEMEGLRKDVMRLSSGLVHRLSPKNEE